MELFTAAASSLVVEQYIIKKLNFLATREDVKQFNDEGTSARPIYKVTITVEQVEPKL